MYHACAENFNPTLALAKTAALAAASEAGNVDLGRRLGEGEVVRTGTDARLLTEHGLGKQSERRAQVCHGNALINDQTLKLMEQRRVGSVNGVRAINAAGADDADGGLLHLHDARLNGRGLGAEQNLVRDVEGVLRVACRVIKSEAKRS